MLKALDKFLQNRTIKSLEDKERFLMLLEKHNTSVESALRTIRIELEKERGCLCNMLA